MKFILSVLILTVNAYCNAQEKYPLNFDADSFCIAKKYPTLWVGKIVAVRGTIKEVRRSHAKPYYFLDIGSNKTIGIGAMVDYTGKKNRTGDIVKVLGYFMELNPDDHTHHINTDEFHIMSFCVVNTETQAVLQHPEKQKQISQWTAGGIPVGSD
ncbi:MAG: hypothetical protein JST70_03040 [Bacteroidetes bacterium]|nr:hypothetical protein [Bacteroidota bacterium]